MKKTNLILPTFALAGIIAAISYTTLGSDAAPPPQQLATPAAAPFQNRLFGAGITEANSLNIEIGTPVAGVVDQVLVTAGQQVKAGELLFTLDSRDLLARASQQEAEIAVAKANLAEITDQLRRAEGVERGVAISAGQLSRLRIQRSSASAGLQAAEAALAATKVEIDRRRITAPQDGTVLQVNIARGEYVGGASTAPLLIFGNTSPMHVRVSIDENDIPHFNQTSPAKAFLRGVRDSSYDLRFVRREPLVVPKRSLSGDSQERIDTRVLNVIYAIDADAPELNVGQQMDIYLEHGQ